MDREEFDRLVADFFVDEKSRPVLVKLYQRGKELEDEVKRMQALLFSPELHDFSKAVVLEAAHQRDRWGSKHDSGKSPSDWFWLLGYLAGKALAAHLAGDLEKAKHHTISSAAALANWHAALMGKTDMRPEIKDPE